MDVDIDRTDSILKIDNYIDLLQPEEIFVLIFKAKVLNRLNDRGIRTYYCEDLNMVVRRYNKFATHRAIKAINIETIHNHPPSNHDHPLALHGIRIYCQKTLFLTSPKK